MGTENRLLVEGRDELWVLPELLERAGIPWGPRGSEIVKIHDIDGFGNLKTDEIGSQLKSAGLMRLGILVDIDADASSRWVSLRSTVSQCFRLPPDPVDTGVVVPAAGHLPRFGVWMMPDNVTKGMLETFMLALGPQNEAQLFQHALDAVDKAKTLNAPFTPSHRDKALIHTWLSWQEPPGRQLHQSVKEHLLDPTCAYAAPFVSWFRELFELRIS